MGADAVNKIQLEQTYSQNIQEHCDGPSWPTYIQENLNPYFLLENFPYNILTAPFTLLKKPWDLVVYLTREKTETELACENLKKHSVSDLHKTDDIGRNLLGKAIAEGSEEVAALYARVGVSGAQRKFGDLTTILHDLAKINSPELLEIVIQARGINVNAKDIHGRTSIHYAVSNNQPNSLRILLNAGGDPMAFDHQLRTPIMLSAKNSEECFNILKMMGGDLNTRDKEGAGIWHYSASNPAPSSIMKTIYNERIPIQLDLKNRSPMHYAVLNSPQAVSDLAYYFPKRALSSNKIMDIVNDPDLYGNAPIHTAAKGRCAESIKMLLKSSASVDALAPAEDRVYINPQGRVEALDYTETALMISVALGDEESVKILLSNSANVNLENSKGQTALNIAVEKGNVKIVRLLLDANSDVNHIPTSGKSPLYDASKNGFVEIAEMLKEKGAVVKAGYKDDFSLHEAVARGDYHLAQKLMLEGAMVNCRDADHHTPLMIAVMRGDFEMALSLLEAAVTEHLKGVMSVRDAHSRQAIHFAANLQDPSILKMLLKYGAGHYAVDYQGKTPLHYAVSSNNLEGLKILSQLKYNEIIKLDIEDNNQITPLMQACREGNIEAAQILIKHGASPTPVDKQNQSCLHIAAKRGDVELMKVLLQAGTEGINWTDNENHPPLYYAAMHQNEELIDLILSAGGSFSLISKDALQQAVLGADPLRVAQVVNSAFPTINHEKKVSSIQLSLKVGDNEITEMLVEKMEDPFVNNRDWEGNTPLLTAAIENNLEQIKEYIKRGADVNAYNNEGLTALHILSAHGNIEAIKLLALAGANLEAKLKNGVTALYLAACTNQGPIVKLLKSFGARSDFKNIMSPSSYSKALQGKSIAFLNLILAGKYKEVQTFLLEGANVNVRDSNGRSALHYAVSKNVPLNILESLIDAGLDLNAEDNKGRTALALALIFKNEEAVSLILRKSKQLKNSDLQLIQEYANEHNLNIKSSSST